MGLKSALGKVVKAPVNLIKKIPVRQPKRAAMGGLVLSGLIVLDQVFGLGLGNDILRLIAEAVSSSLPQ